jgi:hypothetical protein
MTAVTSISTNQSSDASDWTPNEGRRGRCAGRYGHFDHCSTHSQTHTSLRKTRELKATRTELSQRLQIIAVTDLFHINNDRL